MWCKKAVREILLAHSPHITMCIITSINV